MPITAACICAGILGDSLPVMTSLAEKEGLRARPQTIYVDPPYGTRFGYNWQCAEQRWMAAR